MHGTKSVLSAICAAVLMSSSACGSSVPEGAAKTETERNAFPELTGRVVDNANVLSADNEASLAQKLEAFESEVGPQFVIVTVDSLGGQTIDAYTLALANHWGIGSKERNDGVVILVAPTEQKARIEVGLGLEKVLTNEFCSRVMQDMMLPAFRQQQYAKGIEAGAARLISEIKKSPAAPPAPPAQNDNIAPAQDIAA